jgi:hypothetical protein
MLILLNILLSPDSFAIKAIFKIGCLWPNHLEVNKQEKMLSGKITLGFIPCHPMRREAMHPSLDAADHRWRDVAIIPVSLNHHLVGMEIVPPRASIARMREILHVTRHRVHLQNATLTAPLGSLCLGLIVVHGKTEASGNRGNGGKTVATAAKVAWQRAATGIKWCGG